MQTKGETRMSEKCKNCQKPLPPRAKGLDFCSQECAKNFKHEHEPTPKVQSEKKVDTTIEAVLKYMGIEKPNFTKSVAYRHWERFVQFIKENSGKSWNEFVRPRLRSYLGIDFRYIESYLESCLAWGVMKLENGNVVFVGLPKGDPL
jgi:hypothetical protein